MEFLEGTEKIFWGISIVFSVLLLIQYVVNRIGLHFSSSKLQHEMQPEQSIIIQNIDSGFRFISVNSIITFFTFFGWTGVILLNMDGTILYKIGLASITGLIAMFTVNFIVYFRSKRPKSGKLELSEAFYIIGKVSRSIPANKNGKGKVYIELGGKLEEMEAVTNGDAIPVGSSIKIVEVLNNNLIVVEPAMPSFLSQL